MFEDLKLIVEGRTEPTLYAGIAALEAALEKHNASGWKELITNLVTTGDSDDGSTVVEHAVGILYMQVEALFQQMKIVLNLESITITKLADIVEALLFEPSDLDGQILAAVEASDDSVDAFVNALGIKLNLLPEEVMEYVESVSEHTIEALKAVLSRSTDQSEYADPEMKAVLGLLNQYQTLSGPGQASLGMEALTSGMPVGTPMELMVEHYNGRIDPSQYESTIDQLISLAIMAKTPKDALEDEVLHFMEQFYPDLFDFQKARKVLLQRLKSLNEAFA